MMLKNSLLDNSFIQYKHDNYSIGEYFEPKSSHPSWKNMGNTVHWIKADNPLLYKPLKLSLESTIQRLANEKLPNDKESRIELSFQLTKDYGFLYFPRHYERVYNDIKLNQHASLFPESDVDYQNDNLYEGETTDKWLRFISTLQYALKRFDDEDFYQSQRADDRFFNDTAVEMFINEVQPSFDFETQSISLKCDSLASACMLSIVTNKKHLKSCLQCNKLFYAKRSDAMYCNSSCGRNNQGSRRGKSKEL